MRRRLYLFSLRYGRQVYKTGMDILVNARRPGRVLFSLLTATQMRGLLVLISAVMLFGMAGYMLIEGWNAFDALYMTIITVATIGYGETHPLSNEGRIFTITLILLTITVLAYGLSSAVDYVATGQLLKHVAEGQRNSMIKGIKQHFIVAGYGRVGREVASGLRQEGTAFVVVEQDPANIEKAQADGCLVIVGNATEDEVLQQSGIERAKGVICATGSDATNIYIILTARGLKPDLFLIARASDENSEAKMLRAGADRVISPYVLSGRRMANLAVRPYVVDFLDVTGTTGEIEKTLEEIVVEAGSIIENRTIGEAAFSNRTGALILALYRSTGELLTSPHPETLLEAGTRMIVLGTRDALDVTTALSRNFTQLTALENA